MRRRSLLQGVALTALARPSISRAAATRPITIPVASNSFGTSGLRVARDLGLFEQNGLDVKIVLMDSGNAAMAALLSGAAAASEGASGELVVARARGQPVVAIADLYRGYTGTLALAKMVAQANGVSPDSPVPERLKALDGLVIASPSATSIYTLGLRKAANAVGAKIRFTYMAQPAMPAALETNAIQGMISGAPFWSIPVTRGTATTWISGPRRELPPDDVPLSSALLMTLENTAQTDRDLVQRLRKVIADLSNGIAERPDLVKAAEAKLYPDLDAASLNLMLATEMENLRTHPLTIADMEHEIAYVQSSGTGLPDGGLPRPADLLPDY